MTLLACGGGGGGGGGSTTATTPTSTYTINGQGQCVGSNNQQVPYQNCSANNGGYNYQNGLCYNTAGTNVPLSYCQNGNNNGYPYGGNNGYPNGYPNGNGYNPQGQGGQCYGMYYYRNTYGWNWIYCQGYNCSNAFLIPAQSYQNNQGQGNSSGAVYCR